MSQLLPIVGPDNPEVHSVLTIQKAKLKDQHLTCEFTEQRDEESPARAFAVTCQEQVHPDLPHAFSRLVPHLCLLTEQLTETPDYWPSDDEDLPACFDLVHRHGLRYGQKPKRRHTHRPARASRRPGAQPHHALPILR